MAKKSSQDTALRKMNRSQLIEIIYALQQHEQKLIEERDALRAQLEKRSSVNTEPAPQAASSNESVNKIVEQAKQTADHYLESIREMSEKAREANSKIIEAAEKQAESIMKDAELQAQNLVSAASLQAQEAAAIASPAIPYSPIFQADQNGTQASFDEYIPRYASNVSDGYQDRLLSSYDEEGTEEADEVPVDIDLEDIEQKSLTSDFQEDADEFSETLFETDFAPLRISSEDVIAPTVLVTLDEDDWDSAISDEVDVEDDKSDFVSDYDPMPLYPEEYLRELAEEAGVDPEDLDLDFPISDDQALDYSDEFDPTTSISSFEEEPEEFYSDEDPVVLADEEVKEYESHDLQELESAEIVEEGISNTGASDDQRHIGEGEGIEEDYSLQEAAQADESTELSENDSAEIAEEQTPNAEMSSDASQVASAASISSTEAFEPLDPSISGLLSMTRAERKAAKKAAKKARKAAKRSGNPRLEKQKMQVEAKEAQVPEGEDALGHAKELLKKSSVPGFDDRDSGGSSKSGKIDETAVGDFDYEMLLDDADTYKESVEDSLKQAVK